MVINRISGEIPYGLKADTTSYEVERLAEKMHQLEQKLNALKPAEKKFLTRKETMELCRITSPTSLFNWKQAGKLVPKAKAGRKPLYLRQDVIDFLYRILNPSCETSI